MNTAQITGSTSSYARKYALNALFCIDDVKDADSTNKHGKDEPKEPVKSDKVQCPKCGKLVNKKMIDAWGMCAECKSKEAKNGK